MVQLTRTRTAAAITSGLRGPGRVAKELALLKARRAYLASNAANKKMAWKTEWWKAGKNQLKRETSGKCAYCDAPTDVVAHGDVEHFRPKSKYWWLAYCYDNHLFSCQICNQTYKGDNFPCGAAMTAPAPAVTANSTDAALAAVAGKLGPDPLTDAQGMPMATFTAACVAEAGEMLDPYVIDPEPFFKWEADEVNKEVLIKRRGTSALNKAVYKAAVDFLGLDRQELRRWRWELAYKHLSEKKQILDALGNGNAPNIAAARQIALDGIREMTLPSKPFAAMVRYFVRDKWNLNV